MSDKRLKNGSLVQTMEPDVVSRDWTPEALSARRWGADGKIIGHSDLHGLVYHVEHKDGSTAYYEPRELVLIEQGERISDNGKMIEFRWELSYDTDLVLVVGKASRTWYLAHAGIDGALWLDPATAHTLLMARSEATIDVSRAAIHLIDRVEVPEC